MQAPPLDALVPDWPAPPTVRALCSTRQGGHSTGCYAGLNLGLHVGDDPQAVRANRAELQAELGVRALFLNQVHGTATVAASPDAADGQEADAVWTAQSGVACTVMVADCLPVLLCDAQGRQVAAAHAGWRGLLGSQGQGVLEATVATFDASQRPGLLAWLGPCIGPQAFEVGDAVRQAFVDDRAEAQTCFVPTVPGKWLADLPGLARQRLVALGLSHIYGNDGSPAWCTVANASRFFSHRRDGVSGRMAACIWRVA